jgi:hypothetical protein
MLDRNRLIYLRALARGRRKKLDRNLTRFAPKPGQSVDEADAAHAKLLRARAYAAETEDLLRELQHNADN